jgi:FkbM family methyltransferase
MIIATSVFGFMKRQFSRLLHRFLDNRVVPILSGPLQGYLWLPRSGNHAYWIGFYEQDYVREFAKIITPGSTVFDIGAQAGYFSLIASRLSGESGEVFSFEPLPENAEFIGSHCQLNQVKNIKLFESALGCVRARRQFKRQNLFMGHLAKKPDVLPENQSDSDYFDVDVLVLDELWEQQEISAPDVIKIDVEGMEYWVLKGGEKLIRENCPLLFVATHGPSNQERTLKLLDAWNYQVTMIGEGTSRNADYLALPRDSQNREQKLV